MHPTRQSIIQRSFSINLNNNNNEKKNQTTDEETEEFASWIESLSPWPKSLSQSQQVEVNDALNAKNTKPTSYRFSNLLQFDSLLKIADNILLKKYDNVTTEQEIISKPEIMEQDIRMNSTTTNDILTATTTTTTTNENEQLDVEDFLVWEKLIESLPRNLVGTTTTATSTTNIQKEEDNDNFAIADLLLNKQQQDNNNKKQADEQKKQPANDISRVTESMIKDATSRMEFLVAEAATVPGNVQDIVQRASRAFKNANQVEDLVKVVGKLAMDQGLDVREATEGAREVTRSAARIVAVANGLFAAGYVKKLPSDEYGTGGNDETLVMPSSSASSSTIATAEQKKNAASKDDAFDKHDDDDAEDSARPLFHKFKSAQAISAAMQKPVIIKGAEMGTLAGAIYEDDDLKNCHEIGHSLVANGTVADVAWMVTDSLSTDSDFQPSSSSFLPSSNVAQSLNPMERPFMTRTITIRGFDASDDTVDRERLLNTICTANPVSLDGKPNVLFHTGLLQTAKAIKAKVERYIDWAPPSQKIILNGHSIGGSLSVMILLLLAHERGPKFVRNRIVRVYSHGSPPIAVYRPSTSSSLSSSPLPKGKTNDEAKKKKDVNDSSSSPISSVIIPRADDKKTKGNILSPTLLQQQDKEEATNTKSKSSSDGRSSKKPMSDDHGLHTCDVLRYFGLPSDIVFGYIQPWDPVVRFLSDYDALYPLVDDLGADGFTLYANGPRRSLRLITRTILQSWEGWPVFRENWKGTTSQSFRSIGIQHMLLPDPLRYVNDRFITVNVGVPPTESIVRISSEELLPALNATFPLDVFQISFVPQAVRSFVHHFYPAYDITIATHASKIIQKGASSTARTEKKQKKNDVMILQQQQQPRKDNKKKDVVLGP